MHTVHFNSDTRSVIATYTKKLAIAKAHKIRKILKVKNYLRFDLSRSFATLQNKYDATGCRVGCSCLYSGCCVLFKGNKTPCNAMKWWPFVYFPTEMWSL